MSGIVWAVASAFVVGGVLAYAGVWKGWMAAARGFGRCMGFALLYIGVALLLLATAVSVGIGSPAAFWTLIVLAGVVLAVAVVGFWWLPPFLQPRWFRRQRPSREAGSAG